MELVREKIKESANVAALLSGIFADEPLAERGTRSGPAAEAVAVGFDSPQTRLLRRLQLKPSWPRAEYDALAGELGLLPDGALDSLNDVAYERCQEPLCEGDDPLTINPAVLEALLA
jgi:hypothetical protein